MLDFLAKMNIFREKNTHFRQKIKEFDMKKLLIVAFMAMVSGCACFDCSDDLDVNYRTYNAPKMDCDYFDFLNTGRPEFFGEYMVQYSWAEGTCGLLWERKNK